MTSKQGSHFVEHGNSTWTQFSQNSHKTATAIKKNRGNDLKQMHGSDQLSPYDNISRAEVAAIIQTLLRKSELIN